MAAPIDLARYELGGRLGSGADYEVRAAADRETGQPVVVKRPAPQAISRRQHEAIEAPHRPAAGKRRPGRAGRRAAAAGAAGRHSAAAHDDFFGDQLGETYTVIVQERAGGIPLLGDMMARVRAYPSPPGRASLRCFR